LDFDCIPTLSPNCLSLNGLFWRFVFHPSTNQAWPYLASETRWDWVYLWWYGWDWRSFLIGHFFFIVRTCFFLDFVYLFGFGPTLGLGGDNEQIRWESVSTRSFWPNLATESLRRNGH
jgi:hypothetical protein